MRVLGMRVLSATAVLVILGTGALPAVAQPAEPEVRLQVDLVRPWFGPDAPLVIEVEVHNDDQTTLGDLRVGVALYQRVRSRTELERVFAGRLPRSPLEAATVRVDPVPARGSQVLRIEQTFDDLPVFDAVPDGLYPLVVTVRRSSEPTTDEVVTAVSLFTEPSPVPLSVLPVIDLAPGPLLRPDGSPAPDAGRRLALLHRTLEGLPVQGVPLGLSVSPLLLEELEHMTATPLAEEAVAALAAVRRVARGAMLLSVPRVRAELPHLVRTGDLTPEIEAGREVVQAHLGAAPTPLILPPNLAVDEAALEGLPEAGVTAALVPGSLFGDTVLSPADPVTAGDVTLVPVDAGLRDTLDDPDDDHATTRTIAQTAMLFFESPGRERTIAAVIDWDSGRAARFLIGLRDAPWVRGLSPAEVAHMDARTRTIRPGRAPGTPRTYRAAVERAASALHGLRAFTFEDNPVRRRLGTALAVARSTSWWVDGWPGARRYANGIVEEVDRQREHVGVGGAAVTFTSRRGEVPVTVINGAPYPLRVRIELTSAKLRFPEGASRVVDPLEPPGETVAFPALADATGTFPLTIRVWSADGRILVSEEELLVRSTAANVVALVLTLGAAGFLVAWYGRRLLPGRHDPSRSP